MSDRITVMMNGALGKMGRAVSAGLTAQPNLQLIGAVDVKGSDTDFGFLCGVDPLGFGIQSNLEQALQTLRPAVLVDFTNPQAVMKNMYTALSNKTPIVVGTTGFAPDDIKKVEEWCQEFDTPAFIAANFALGAVLMMRFAKEAARYMPNVEVIERHHDQKLDAPSGTAITTLEMISQERQTMTQGNLQEFERLNGSRGGEYQGMRVHSVRLPGYVATQEVVFGDIGQTLCIRHDSLSRECYVPGVTLAVTKILEQKGLVQGLESLL